MNDDETPQPELELSPPYATMSDLYRDVERNLVVVLDAYAAENIAPTCLKGCDACCHQLVMTTMAEAGEAARHLASLPEAARERLEGRIGAWLETTADLRRKLQEEAAGDLEEVVDDLAARYWERRVACPFLVDRQCAVYEARPLICRHHFSVSDPALCEAGDDGIERMEAVEEAFFVSQGAIPDEEAEIGFFPELVSIALAGSEG